MKKYFIMLVLVLAHGGGGYFAWTEYFAGTSAGIVLPSLLSRDDKPLYIEIERLTAPFIRDQRFVQYVVLDVSLEVVEERDADKVRQLTPRLRDAFLGELHRLATIRPARQKLINVARVKARLLAGADRVLGPRVVRDVLVQLAH